ncbi:MAG: ABC transporter permease subunit [Deltaproteobacteria bacterium]|nr:ABC transporter permease subunit [Deltaproteobacteria bacterium]MCB9789310.1 ABC transporter permease subunit [Deltaproteobacteria bacterium]
MSTRALRVVASYEVERLVRSPHGAAVLLLFVTLYGWAAWSLRRIAETFPVANLGQDSEFAAAVSRFVAQAAGLKDDALSGLLRDHPPLLVAIFALSVMLTPLLAILLSSDQTATDIRTRHLRFLLLRTDRLSLYLGRFAGSLAAFAIAQAVAVAAVVIAISPARVGGTEGFLYLFRGYVTVLLLAAPCVALMAALDALSAQATRALMLALLLWVALAIAVAAAGPDFQFLDYGFPTAGKYRVLADRASDMAPTLAFQAIYAAAALALGFVRFRRRDL